MNPHYFVLLFILFENSFGYIKPNHHIDRQAKSIFSNKKCTESFIPARYKVGMKSTMFDQPLTENIMPEQYFPGVEYPTNIIESSRPFFYKTGESNAMLGSFPDDVKSSYKTLMEKNKKSLEEIKVQYINELPLNARNCIQENRDSIPEEETIVEEAVATYKDNYDDAFVDEIGEVKIDEASQNIVVPNIGEEKELSDSTSESIENIEENKEITDTKDQELPTVEKNEEKVVAADYIQSWESEQYYSDEIITKLSEGEDLGPELETQFFSEEILEDTDNNSTLVLTNVEELSVSSFEVVSEVVEPENTEAEPYPYQNQRIN